MFSVKATLVGFIGDPEHYPCHAGIQVGDEVIFNGNEIIGKCCGDAFPALVEKMVTVSSTGPRYVDPGYYHLFWHSVNSYADPERAKYDGNGFVPVNEPFEHPAHHVSDLIPKGGFCWPPTEERVACKDCMVMCPDLRTAATWKVEAFDLATAGHGLPYTRRQMTIMDRVTKAGGSYEINKIMDLYDDFEINEIYPTLVPSMIREMIEELELLDFATTKDGVVTITEKGKERVARYKTEIPAEHAEALKL
ncbi:MAG: hypothetical protein IJP23_02080 [Oscillospiraceae bacterium]|nr:hypothetical protein [Oscillospiraceae bacterium]